MSLNIQMLVEKYSQWLSHHQGPQEGAVEGLNAPHLAKPRQAIFISDAGHSHVVFYN